MTPIRIIAEAANELARKVPLEMLMSIAEAIGGVHSAGLSAEIDKRVPHPQHRELTHRFVNGWRRDASEVDAASVSMALQTAGLAVERFRKSRTNELVWTGPKSYEVPLRRTEQAILQVLETASSRITLISYAVYRIPNVAAALVGAARRGVKLTVILETPDKLGGKNEYSTLRQLGPEVEACSSVYFWPLEKRPTGENAKPGSLHVKCVVADGKQLFLSSANLTQQAFTINMELGILVRGGSLPRQVERQFDGLIQRGELIPID